MATFMKTKSDSWRAQVRRKGQYASATFRRKAEAERWALDTERRIDLGEDVTLTSAHDATTFGELLDIHLNDLREVGKKVRRSKRGALKALRRRIGHLRIDQMTRERLIEFGKKRAKDGISPSTLGSELSYIGTVLTHAAAVHGLNVSIEPVQLARKALNRLGLVGHSQERDRRPTQDELDAIIRYVDSNPRQTIPIGRIVKFAVATAMRQEEISRILRSDLCARTRTQLVRDRKDPHKKEGNHQKVPLLDLTGYDEWDIIQEQLGLRLNNDRLFPYNPRSVGAAFRRACKKLDIADLRFHDLRHEATSRLFEAGLKIQEVALVTGHRDWKMLNRYTHLRPEHLTKKYGPPDPPPPGIIMTTSSPWSKGV